MDSILLPNAKIIWKNPKALTNVVGICLLMLAQQADKAVM
jgi:hypothetical protein